MNAQKHFQECFELILVLKSTVKKLLEKIAFCSFWFQNSREKYGKKKPYGKKKTYGGDGP